jgi:hypothetical protein
MKLYVIVAKTEPPPKDRIVSAKPDLTVKAPNFQNIPHRKIIMGIAHINVVVTM